MKKLIFFLAIFIFLLNIGLCQSNCATLYSECNFQGESLQICQDQPIPDFQPTPFVNLNIKSVQIPEGQDLIIYCSTNYEGQKFEFTEDASCIQAIQCDNYGYQEINSLEPLQYLDVNDKLISSNGEFQAILQNDGNFVIKSKDDSILWSTNTQNRGSAPYKLEYTENGFLLLTNNDFVQLDAYGIGKDNVLWALDAQTGSKITLEDDGRLVLYDADNQEIWSSTDQFDLTYIHIYGDTLYPGQKLLTGEQIASKSYDYGLMLYEEGVLEFANFETLFWNSQTEGLGTLPYELVFTDDCNLILQDSTQKTIWETQTQGSNCRLYVSDDGNLDIFNGDGVSIWSYKTNNDPQQ